MNDHNQQGQSRKPRERTERSSAEKKGSKSQQASREAKRGGPLKADRPRDRSPKQENL
jgi:hypothetical protein